MPCLIPASSRLRISIPRHLLFIILCVTVANILWVLLYMVAITAQIKQTFAFRFVMYAAIFNCHHILHFPNCLDNIEFSLFRCKIIDVFPTLAQAN